MSAKKILITLGDPNGIGPEITEKSLSLISPNLRKNIELIGSKLSLEKILNQYPEVAYYDISCDYKINPGLINVDSGIIAIRSIDYAIDLLKTEKYLGLVTGPVSKEAITLAQKKSFVGHTEYLGKKFDLDTKMIFWSSIWSVILVTRHIPLSQVPAEITAEKMREILKFALDFNKKYYGDLPVGVCGLNPHAGENGIIATEELDILIPIIREFQIKGYRITEPISPDIIFRYAEKKIYRTIVSLYHDQGLIPFKLLHFYDGINVTFGLPFIRTSPNHGTAFDIAGKNIADPSGMVNAIKFVESYG